MLTLVDMMWMISSSAGSFLMVSSDMNGVKKLFKIADYDTFANDEVSLHKRHPEKATFGEVNVSEISDKDQTRDHVG
jgi:hypothetical protein